MGDISPSHDHNIVAFPKRRHHRNPISTRKMQKTAAKLGMAGSLGALFVSGFVKFKGAKSLHLYSGFGLLAFTIWHHLLNQPKKRLKRR